MNAKGNKRTMENKFGNWIIRYSTGNSFAYHGYYEDAEKIAKESVKGTDTTYVIA